VHVLKDNSFKGKKHNMGKIYPTPTPPSALAVENTSKIRQWSRGDPEGTVNSMEQKTRVFCQTDVQEFHLSLLIV